MLAVVGFVVAAQGTAGQRATWLIGLAASVVAALAWAWLFCTRHELWAAALATDRAGYSTSASSVATSRSSAAVAKATMLRGRSSSPVSRWRVADAGAWTATQQWPAGSP